MAFRTVIFRLPLCAIGFVVVSSSYSAPALNQSLPLLPSDSVRKTISGVNVRYSDENIVDTGSGSSAAIVKPRRGADFLPKKQDSLATSTQGLPNAPLASLRRNQSGKPMTELDSVNKAIFYTLGGYHRLMGIYGLLSGALTIIAGAVLIDKKDAAPFAMSFIALGGISMGLGLWEGNVGVKFARFKAPER